jgi:CDP-glycerol glycerophosphotransferase (TagB/SpsB family)
MLNHGIGYLKNGKKYYDYSKFTLNDGVFTISDFHKSIYVNEYGFPPKRVHVTGYPRFDGFADKKDNSPIGKFILLAPTFRDNQQQNNDEFTNTDFFYNYSELIHSALFQGVLEKYNLKCVVFLHQNIYNNCRFFQLNDALFFCANELPYSLTELMEYATILITDYSSVMFDFHYLGKPVISYQFDYQDFASQRDEVSFINIRSDVPARICDTVSEVSYAVEFFCNEDYNFSHPINIYNDCFFKYYDSFNTNRVIDVLFNSKEYL